MLEQQAWIYINKDKQYLINSDSHSTEPWRSIDTKIVTYEDKIEIENFLAIPCTIQIDQYYEYTNSLKHGFVVYDSQKKLVYSQNLYWTNNLLDICLFEHRIHADAIIQNMLSITNIIKVAAYKIVLYKFIEDIINFKSPSWFAILKSELKNFEL